MTGIPVLTIEDVASLDGVLGDFLKKAEAELTVVIDRGEIERFEFKRPELINDISFADSAALVLLEQILELVFSHQ